MRQFKTPRGCLAIFVAFVFVFYTIILNLHRFLDRLILRALYLYKCFKNLHTKMGFGGERGMWAFFRIRFSVNTIDSKNSRKSWQNNLKSVSITNCININFKSLKIHKSISISCGCFLVINLVVALSVCIIYCDFFARRVRKYVVAYLYARCKNIFAFQMLVVATATATATAMADCGWLCGWVAEWGAVASGRWLVVGKCGLGVNTNIYW